LELGALVTQSCDRSGAWLSTSLAYDAPLSARMTEEAHFVGRALHEIGYFGPFGIDAFVYHDKRGGVGFQPRSEINARYSMGFAVGFKTD
jgi:hypothetical protein